MQCLNNCGGYFSSTGRALQPESSQPETPEPNVSQANPTVRSGQERFSARDVDTAPAESRPPLLKRLPALLRKPPQVVAPVGVPQTATGPRGDASIRGPRALATRLAAARSDGAIQPQRFVPAGPAAPVAAFSATVLEEFASRISAARKVRAAQAQDSLRVEARVNIDAVWNALSARTSQLQFDFLKSEEAGARFSNIHAPRRTALPDPTQRFPHLHASFIDFGVGVGGRMIAAQRPIAAGPQPTTEAFWLAAVRDDVPLIVDLTNDSDNRDEAAYSPADIDDVLRFQRVNVCLSDVESNGPFDIELLRVDRKQWSIRKSVEIKRLHFQQWPDHGVIAPRDLLLLANVIRTCCPDRDGMLVHCRAGVGRTGTLLSFIAAGDALAHAGCADPQGHAAGVPSSEFARIVLETVLAGRRDRGPGFIQTKAQFALLVDTLLLQETDPDGGKPSATTTPRVPCALPEGVRSAMRGARQSAPVAPGETRKSGDQSATPSPPRRVTFFD